MSVHLISHAVADGDVGPHAPLILGVPGIAGVAMAVVGCAGKADTFAVAYHDGDNARIQQLAEVWRRGRVDSDARESLSEVVNADLAIGDVAAESQVVAPAIVT